MPMLTLTINVEENPWEDLRREDLVHITTPIRVGGLPQGMKSGKASVALGFTLPDGRPVIAETSMELFLGAARAFRAVYGEFGEGNQPDPAASH